MVEKQAQVLSFFSGKGGVGKSSICTAIGMSLALHKKSVLWIDMDLGWRNLDFILKADRDIVFDLSHIFQGVCHWREALISPPTAPHCHLIAGTLTQISPPAMTHILTDLIAQARGSYDYILIDLGSGFDEIHEFVLNLCDLPVLISTTDLSSLRSVDKILGIVPVDKKPLWILNQFPFAVDTVGAYAQELNYPISAVIPLFPLKLSFWSTLFGHKEKDLYEKVIPHLSQLALKIPSER